MQHEYVFVSINLLLSLSTLKNPYKSLITPVSQGKQKKERWIEQIKLYSFSKQKEREKKWEIHIIWFLSSHTRWLYIVSNHFRWLKHMNFGIQKVSRHSTFSISTSVHPTLSINLFLPFPLLLKVFLLLSCHQFMNTSRNAVKEPGTCCVLNIQSLPPSSYCQLCLKTC